MEQAPGSTNKKMLTQYQKSLKRAERERQRIVREHQLEIERKKRREEKELKSREKQAKKDEEERIKEEKRQRRLEEQRKREEEKDAERKRKEEEKRKKEEERLQRDLERKREEDFKIKQEEKQRAVLLGFLVKGEQKKEAPQSLSLPSGPFMQFQLRKDMRMAPSHRVSPDDLVLKRSNLDSLFLPFNSVEADVHSASSLGLTKFGRTNYLHELRTGQRTPLTCQSTWPNEPPNIQLLSDGLCSVDNWPTLRYHGCRGSGGTVWMRAKLFQFVENYRPAYYGTWRRRSHVVTGRRPFAQDRTNLDYTVDSDDEWEEEEPGESITQSENEEEDEKEEEDDEDEDDQFLVPHGYLSDDEGVVAEEAGEDDAGNEEMKTLRRRLSAVEYEVAHRRGLQRLKPTVLGPVWLPDPLESEPFNFSAAELDADKENFEHAVNHDPGPSDIVDAHAMRLSLCVYRVHLWDAVVPISIRFDTLPIPTGRRAKKELPEDAIPYLIHLVHKSPLGKPKLAFEFRVFWHQHTTGTIPDCTQYNEYKRHSAAASLTGTFAHRCGAVLTGPAWDDLALSQNLILNKIAEIAVFEEGRWVVHPEVIRRFGIRLAAVTGISELLQLSASDDDESLSSIVFPPWHYLTDVVTITKKGKRPSAAKRRSLEVPVPTELESPQPSSTHPTHPDSLRVLIEPLKPLDRPTTYAPTTAVSRPVESKRTVLATLQCTPSLESKLVDRATTMECPKTDRDSVLNGTPVNRKRVTLDAFFTPPTKRHHTRRDGEAETPDYIIID